ncbi:Site-specific recombinase XerD [Pedobacter westerhofensis]|uniref:Site-specific recombinase XerD n=1 Tax=Pedobacter westerhofensis TaxID=425512 RepID=A0A521FVR1_9SPHI|nr:site-specific integrase [Pedobacter westerhofensis]SMO99751.1 Site-specific recombinase XerD [Pedobacter westerhofensis]
MFTDPKIVTTNDIKIRSYISYYYEGKRFREYNAKKLNADINPNFTVSLPDRNRLLNKLQYEFKKALELGWSPLTPNNEKNKLLLDAMNEVLSDKLDSPYSETYKRDLSKLHEQFISFLPKSVLNQYVSNLDLKFVELFLNQFKSSNRHYMNKRRTLSVFFSEMVRRGYSGKNLILSTTTQKPKSVLHDVYSSEDLKAVLQFLEGQYPNLYLCCLITYGCLLRPHQEIRLLKRGNISKDFTKIQLSGDENKSGRVRTVHIPDYLKLKLEKQLSGIDDKEANIFTLESNTAFNSDYFKTQWSRAKMQMAKLGIISKNQTIYSFRHTAAVNVYRKSKDLHLLQQLLQHSNMIVTLNYLRGLGEVNDERLKEFLPEL